MLTNYMLTNYMLTNYMLTNFSLLTPHSTNVLRSGAKRALEEARG